MRLLLDSNVLIWSLAQPALIRERAREALESSENELVVSLATLWEVGLKHGTGRLPLRAGFQGFVVRVRELRATFLEIRLADIERASSLPFHHRDPFDRMLIAQALAENIPIVTSDRRFAEYGVQVVW